MGLTRSDLPTLDLFKALRRTADPAGITEIETDGLRKMVDDVANIAEPLLARISHTFRQYTGHDLAHSLNIIDMMGRFVPPSTLKKLNALELAMVMLAALLHDGGMYLSEAERQSFLDNEDYHIYLLGRADRVAAAATARKQGRTVRAEAIESALLAEFVRRRHASRVRGFIESNNTLHRLLTFRSVDLTDKLVDLCESHAWPVRNEGEAGRGVEDLDTDWRVHNVRVNLQYLGCMLRLADILDFDRTRTPLSVFERMDFTEDKSWEEWNKHLQITGWNVSPDHVRYQAECTHPAFYVAVHEFLDWIDAELREVSYLLDDAPRSLPAHYRFELPQAVDRRPIRMKDSKYITGGFRFTLDYDRILKLLMDRSLYPDPSLFLRELLQNSVDACRLAGARASAAKALPGSYNPAIAVWDHSHDEKNPHVIFQDNGVGMSRRIVEDYFMRVGRSFYRSHEFEVERGKLAEQKIELEASSQFGIGILSCFLVADRFVVETYRFNNEPLRITIEGPSKFFLIERLPKPEITAFQTGAPTHLEDGPPTRPGTRITLYLRPGTSIDVTTTLATFAVNIDYDLHIYSSDTGISTKLPRFRWEPSQLSVLGQMTGHLVLTTGINTSQAAPSKEEIATAVNEIVVASRIPFEKWEFSKHFRGACWFWLLGGPEGPTPRAGFLSVGETIRLRGFPLKLCHLRHARSDNPESAEARLAHARDVNSQSISLDEEDLQELLGDEIEIWRSLSGEQAQYAWDILMGRNDDIPPWFAVPSAARAILKGNLEWLTGECSLPDGQNFDDVQLLPGHVAKKDIALHGVLIPGGVSSWNPAAGVMTRHDLLPVAGVVQLDVRGDRAPSPAASRLFIQHEEGMAGLVPFYRAVLRHAVELSKGASWEWRWWLRTLLDRALNVVRLSREAFREERAVLDAHVPWEVLIGESYELMSVADLQSRFGTTIPVAVEAYEGDRRDGVRPWEPLTHILVGNRLSKDRQFIALT